MENLLIIGFSIIAPKQVQKTIVDRLAIHGHECSIVSLGGHHIFSISYLIQEILLQFPCASMVILDLESSAIRGFIQEGVWKSHLHNIIKCCQSKGLHCGLISFYRNDVDYRQDEIGEWTSEVSHELNVTRLHAHEYINIHDQNIRQLLVHDTVHVSEHGATAYANLIASLANKLVRISKPSPFEHKSRFTSFSFCNDFGSSQDDSIVRHGYKIPLTYLRVGEQICVDFSTIDYYIRGIVFINGPHSANFLAETDSPKQSIEVICNDERSYYERIAVHLLSYGKTTNIVLAQTDVRRNCNMVKGSLNSNIIGKLGYLLALQKEG